jgi:hypothetical protein
VTRRVWIPFTVLLGFCALAGVGLWLAYRSVEGKVREHIVAEAKKRGFELTFDELRRDGDVITLTGVTARPIGVRGVAATIAQVDATVSGLDWKSLLLGGADQVQLTQLKARAPYVRVLGSAPALALELTQWSERYPSAYDLPAEATEVALAWRATESVEPWAQLTGGSVTRTTSGGRFEAVGASVLGRSLGAVGSRWSKETGRISLELGESEGKPAPVRVDIQLDETNPTATVELRPTVLRELSGALGVALPLENVTAQAKATLKLPPELAAAPVPGQLHFELLGYVPPHPVELDGFVFGDRTTFDTDFEVAADQKSVKLSNTRAAAGAFVLKGDGEIQRGVDNAIARLRLSGSLPCVALASAAADTRLGQHWSAFAKQLVKKNLEGTVGVTVNIEADTRDLSQAKMVRSIGMGCGLKPLRLPTPDELAAFQQQLPGLVGELPKLPEKLPQLPSGLPSLPSALPTGLPSQLPGGLPTLPKLPEGLPPLPDKLPAKKTTPSAAPTASGKAP